MYRYDIIHEELQDRVDCGMLALEDAEIIDDLAYERYADARSLSDVEIMSVIIESMEDLLDDSFDDYYSEALVDNESYSEEMAACKDKIKQYTKMYKKNLKTKKFDDARKNVKQIQKELDGMENYITNTRSYPGDIIFGAYNRYVEVANNATRAMMPLKIASAGLKGAGMLAGITGGLYISLVASDPNIPKRLEKGPGMRETVKQTMKKYDNAGEIALKIASATAFVTAATAISKEIRTIIYQVKKKGKLTPEEFNAYKNKLIMIVRKMRKNANKAMETVDKAEAKYKERMK